jgi:hypothetical protein
MGARSYVPQIGRFLQPDPKPGGSANAYSYTFGDPVNSTDPSGESTMPSSWSLTTSVEQANATAAPWLAEQAAKRAAEEAARAAEEAAARREAEGAAQQAEWASWWSGYDASFSGGEEEEWSDEEWSEEEGEYEYAKSEHLSSEGAHPEFVSFHQPLSELSVREDSGVVADGPKGVMRDTSAGVGGGAHAYGKRVRANVRIRRKNGSWTKVFDTYCGIVGGAALTPGVDIFGAPAEVGCAGYGVIRGVEAIVEGL